MENNFYKYVGTLHLAIVIHVLHFGVENEDLQKAACI